MTEWELYVEGRRVAREAMGKFWEHDWGANLDERFWDEGRREMRDDIAEAVVEVLGWYLLERKGE